MDYLEFKFFCRSTTVDTETLSDILAAELGEIGFETFQSIPDGLLAYIPASAYDREKLDDVLAMFPIEPAEISFEQQQIKARNWNEEWEKNYFQPVRIADRCLIRASFHPTEKGFEYQIVINPKMAFGTGNHATTRLMVESILATDLCNASILDMGCGTGVLAILAKMCGAGRVVAVDIDRWAYENTIENCRLNGCPDIEILCGDASTPGLSARFDHIYANINRNILLNDIPTYAAMLNTGGTLCMSGFYTTDLPVLETACRQNGLVPKSHAEHDGWASLTATLANKG